AESGDAEKERCEPEGVSGGPKVRAETGSGEQEEGEENPNFGVVADIADDAHEALADDNDLQMGIHMSLDVLVEERGVEPVGVGAIGKLFVAEDGWALEELLFRMLEVEIGGAEEGGLVSLKVHLLG